MQDTDILVTCTGNANVCDSAILSTLKKGAVVCNIGHFDNEIDTAFARTLALGPSERASAHGLSFRARRDYLILLSEGRLVNGQRHGHPLDYGWILRESGAGANVPV